MCGLTPSGGLAETWIVAFRALQGLGGAIMFPAALAIVVQTFDLHSRGRALALFFGIAGGLTAIGPIAGATRDVLYTMAAIMAVAALVALRGLKHGVQQDTETEQEPVGEDPDADLYPTSR